MSTNGNKLKLRGNDSYFLKKVSIYLFRINVKVNLNESCQYLAHFDKNHLIYLPLLRKNIFSSLNEV